MTSSCENRIEPSAKMSCVLNSGLPHTIGNIMYCQANEPATVGEL